MVQNDSVLVGGYRPRLVDEVLPRVLAGLPAVSLTGPRGCGKTTTASRYAATVVHLNRPGDAALFRADPDAALRRMAEPVLLDEWQEVPEVLGAVKRAVDLDPRPGRFLLTGSVSAQIDAAAWPGTGRVTRLTMGPMGVRETLGLVGGDLFVDRLAAGDLSAFGPADGLALDVVDYLDLAARGGFPGAALVEDPTLREAWTASYLDELVHHDASLVRAGLDPHRLAGYLEAVALANASVVDDKTLFDAAHIDRRTADAYWGLLERLFVVEAVPAWASNRLTRLVRRPKRYMLDTSLALSALRLDAQAAGADPQVLGSTVDALVAAQLRPEAGVARLRPRLHHLRDKEGRHEVDLLVELGGRKVAAVEVKATAAPRPDDARHLAWLRDQLGDRFVMGVVLHTGPYDLPLGDRIVAAPISTLWRGSSRAAPEPRE